MTKLNDKNQSVNTVLGVQIHFKEQIVTASLYKDLPFNWGEICSLLKKNMDQKCQEHVEKGYMFIKTLKVAITLYTLEEESLTILVVFEPENEEIAQMIIPDLTSNMEILAELFRQKYRDSKNIGFLSHQEFEPEIDKLFKDYGV